MKTVGWDGPVGVGRITLSLSTVQGPWGGWLMGAVVVRVVGDMWGGSPPPAHPSFLLQRCFQTTNGYLSDSRSCASNYNVAALATSSLVGGCQLPSPVIGVCTFHSGQPWGQGQGWIAAGTAPLSQCRALSWALQGVET